MARSAAAEKSKEREEWRVTHQRLAAWANELTKRANGMHPDAWSTEAAAIYMEQTRLFEGRRAGAVPGEEEGLPPDPADRGWVKHPPPLAIKTIFA